jgi:betaine reductase
MGNRDTKSQPEKEEHSMQSFASVPVVKAVALCLAHVPDLVRYGSKPSRDLIKVAGLLPRLAEHRRSYEHAVSYPPHQVFIGNLAPEQLWDLPQPWWQNLFPDCSRHGRDGEIITEAEFYGLMKLCDEFKLLSLTPEFASLVRDKMAQYPLLAADAACVAAAPDWKTMEASIGEGMAIPLYHGEGLVGGLHRGEVEDDSLTAPILLENLAAKASAVMALRHALNGGGIAPQEVEYILGCGEEAIGDRYQRGGGNLAKAVGEKAGCSNATGSDVKAFCCAPNHAITIAAALVKAGLFRTVAVVGGGSLAKLGMKYQGHLRHNMPVLEDMLASIAVIISRDDGASPIIDLNCIGRHTIDAGSSQLEIAEAIVYRPLQKCGLRITDIDRFATELHNPELTLPQGSGNVPQTNYRMLASLAAHHKEITTNELNEFVRSRGMPGFSPTQGHIASAVAFLGHARQQLMAGTLNRIFFYAKGSLFLGRMTSLADGLSFLLRRNNQEQPTQ